MAPAAWVAPAAGCDTVASAAPSTPLQAVRSRVPVSAVAAMVPNRLNFMCLVLPVMADPRLTRGRSPSITGPL